MKCICGYENKSGEYNIDTNKMAEEVDKEKFIKIKGYFTISSGDSYHCYDREVDLIACPKCNTIQMRD